MGYRFELQHANIVAHLLEGDVNTFMDLMNHEDDYYSMKSFINETLSNHNFIADKYYEYSYYRVMEHIKYILDDHDNHNDGEIRYNYRLREYVEELFHMFKYIEVKALLISGNNDGFMSDKRLLKEILHLSSHQTFIILQIYNYQEDEICLMNAFRGLEEAIKQKDRFPGVLLWDKDHTLFVPVKNREEVIGLFRKVFEYDYHPIENFKKKYNSTRSTGEYLYLMHMSDIHIGKAPNSRIRELVRLIKEHPIQDEGVPIIPIITGDLMDTPNQENKDKVDDLLREVSIYFSHEIIEVLGNHDIDENGIFSYFRKNKQATIMRQSNSSIEIFEKYKLIIIKVCSNRGGDLARGEIGEAQLVEIACELGNVKNVGEYSCVAIMHHHPIEISHPDWYSKRWFEKILGPLHENTIKLKDSERFLLWCNERGIKIILHGHKHIPSIKKKGDIYCIASGSSTGEIAHVDTDKTYITYNIIKYDLNLKKPVLASIYFEDVIGSKLKHLQTVTLN